MVDIREVGPRDGLQAEEPVSVEARVQLVERLVDAGVRHIEACSFVSPKAVPSMAGGADVMGSLTRRPGVVYTALVPNQRGAEMALAAGVDEITVTVSASEAYNQKNVRMSVEESVAAIASICTLAGSVPVDAVVSCAFGSPYEGEISVDVVVTLGQRLLAGGAARITFADTTGMATPPRVEALVSAWGSADFGLHLHETRGTGLVNAYRAFECGVRSYDTSVGGLGGSPFAAGAAGNLATEDWVYLLGELGVPTGIDLDRLLEVSAWLGDVIGHPVPSRVAAAGPRTRLAAG